MHLRSHGVGFPTLPLWLGACLWVAALPAAWAQGRAATLIAVQGATSVRRSGSPEFLDASRKMTLSAGDIVRTGPNGRATLLFADGSQVKLNANTVLLIPTGTDRGLPARMGLSTGELWARVTHGKRTRIETPSALAWVRGTELDLVVTRDGTATLTVGEGEVRFENPQGSVRVAEGQQSLARPGQAPTAPVLVNVPFVVQWTNDLQPVVLALELAPGSPDPARLREALAEAGRLPEGAERQRRIGLVQLERGRLPEAEAAFRRSLELDPSGGTARAGLVMTLLSRRENAAALAEARTGVEREPRSSLAHTVLALAQIRAGDRDGARRSLGQALALDGNDAQAHAWLSFLMRAEGRLRQAEAEARRAVTLAPRSSLARQSLSEALFAQGQVPEAKRAAKEAVGLNPLSPGAHVSLGRSLLQAGDLAGAAREANTAVALDPDLDRARFFYGVVLAEQGRLGRAARELERAVALDPGFLEARAMLARVYLEQGREGEAIGVVREALARDPGFGPARAALGRVYWRAGRLKEAAGEYRQALGLEPGSVLYALELARVHLDANNLPDALANGLAAVSGAPTSSEAHAVLGLIYDRMSNPEQALREYREAVSFSPDNALARFGLGTSIIRPGTSGDALSTARAAAQERSGIGIRELAQGALRDPTVPMLLFKPGVTTEIAPGFGSDSTYGTGFTHRGAFLRGMLHDLSLGTHERRESYRDGRSERDTLAVMNLTAAPNYRTHFLAVYQYAAGKNGLPGSVFRPDADDRSSSRSSIFSLSTRLQVTPSTFLWFHAAQWRPHIRVENLDAPSDGQLIGSGNFSLRQLTLEGRLDHRWGRAHTTSYVLFAGREDAESRALASNGATFAGFAHLSRRQPVAHTLQHDYRPSPRLSLILGLTTERFTEKSRDETAGVITFVAPGTDQTSWLPFGQATFAVGRRDLLRVIAHKRRERNFGPLLPPSEAFIVGEFPSLEIDGKVTNQEIDYEHRFSPRGFGKLFLFRSGVEGLSISPAVMQTLLTIGYMIPHARIQGAGVRYEQQIGRFLSGYLRYTASEATDRSVGVTRGRRLPFSPRSQAVLGLNYIDRAGTKLLAEATWQDTIFIDSVWPDREEFARAPRPRLPSKLVVNLRLGKEPSVRREWVLRIGNLFDVKTLYWLGFPRPGRSYRLEYLIRF